MDTETTCHCGCSKDGSDHCPYCGCEEYERTCAERHPDVQEEPEADCQCRAHWNAACEAAENAEAEHVDNQGYSVHDA